MDLLDWPLKFIIAFALGAVIGLEREINEQKDIKGDPPGKHAVLGLRSFSLTAGLGALTGAIVFSFPGIAAILFGGFLGLLFIFYYLDSKSTNDTGATTEIAVLYSYILGFAIATNLLPVQILVAITVVLVLLMSRKENIKAFVEDIKKRELNALISYGILALVILPFLPNETYALSDFPGLEGFLNNVGWNIQNLTHLELINPFKLWLIVVLITGVDLLGYILERTIGQNRGWLIASLVGGFVSSTATTISIARESVSAKNHNPLLAGAIFANMVSFLPVAVILATLNPALLIQFLTVFIVLIATAMIIGVYFYRFSPGSKDLQTAEEKAEKSHSIFSLTSALKFMGIYLVINIASKIALELFGTGGFLATTAIGSLTGIDAVVINTAQLAGSRIDLGLGVWALILANGVNLLAKSVYSFMQGDKKFAVKLTISMVIIIAASITAAFFSSLI
jgi:uncharacterized membrane protein (DUF4010 family)